MTSRIVFACINGLHVADAEAVAQHLRSPVTYLDVNTMECHSRPPTIRTPFTSLRPRQVLGGVRGVPLRCRDVLVVPQDVGILPQVLVATARRRGALSVLVPDGVVGGTHGGPAGPRARLRAATYAASRATRLSRGRPGVMGSSTPDVILSWGPGWDRAFACGASTRILPVGAVRLDGFAGFPEPVSTPRVLVCSQPLGQVPWSAAAAGPWYAFLETLLSNPPAGLEVRVRAHPAERLLPGVSSRLVGGETRDLKDDLTWATHVAAPFSTVLVEAAAAGRIPLVMAGHPLIERGAQSIPFTADPRVDRCVWKVEDLLGAVTSSSLDESLLADYVSNRGNGALSVAAKLDELVPAP